MPGEGGHHWRLLLWGERDVVFYVSLRFPSVCGCGFGQQRTACAFGDLELWSGYVWWYSST